MLMNFPVLTLPENVKNCAPGKIKVFSPAKINIYLNIIGKYNNGFHKIESIVNRISLFDEITIALNIGGKLRFNCDCRKLVTNGNLCLKAAALLKRRYRLNSGFDIYLKKNIPIGGGLGGGSSNAAYTILGINRLLNLGLSIKELMVLGEELGSDVNFFFSQVPWAYLSGRGQIVKPLNIAAKFNYLLVYPNQELSTALVYGRLKSGLTKFINNVSILTYALRKKDYSLVERLSFNCLETSALSLKESLRGVKRLLVKEGFFCRLSGSGSTFFSFLRSNPFKKNKSVNILMSKVRKKGFLAFIVRTY